MSTDALHTPDEKESLNYRAAGVDIEAGHTLVERIKPIAARTRLPGVLAGLGGFGALFELPSGYLQPVLVATTDGVGTKLKLAIDTGRHRVVGIDLVAMCVNDIVVQGAAPLFFLDYYATGALDCVQAEAVIEGIGYACEQVKCALIGGETAEMPGVYQRGDYDLAGFCVGIVEKNKLLDGSHVRPGDRLIGLASSGPHANGYSLIRKILERSGPLDILLEGRPLVDWLMEPTRLYVSTLLRWTQSIPVHAFAHITGGGITENLPRVLPDHTRAQIDLSTWTRSPIFHWLQKHGRVTQSEMLRTFNCGVGMIACVPPEEECNTLALLQDLGETAWTLGEVIPSEGPPVVEYLGAW